MQTFNESSNDIMVVLNERKAEIEQDYHDGIIDIYGYAREKEYLNTQLKAIRQRNRKPKAQA